MGWFNHQLANLWFCRFYSLKVPFHHPTSPPPQKRTTTIADLVVNFPRKHYNCSEFHVGSVHDSFFKKTQMSPFTTTDTTTGWGGATALFGLLTWDDVWTLGSSRFATVSHTGFGKSRVFIRDESLMFMFWKKMEDFLDLFLLGMLDCVVKNCCERNTYWADSYFASNLYHQFPSQGPIFPPPKRVGKWIRFLDCVKPSWFWGVYLVAHRWQPDYIVFSVVWPHLGDSKKKYQLTAITTGFISKTQLPNLPETNSATKLNINDWSRGISSWGPGPIFRGEYFLSQGVWL